MVLGLPLPLLSLHVLRVPLFTNLSPLTRKDPDAGKDGRQEEKGATEDEMVGWHHRPKGRESERSPGDGKGTGKPGVLQSMGLQRVGHN